MLFFFWLKALRLTYWRERYGRLTVDVTGHNDCDHEGLDFHYTWCDLITVKSRNFNDERWNKPMI